MPDDLQQKRLRRSMYAVVDQVNLLLRQGGTKSTAMLDVTVVEEPRLHLRVISQLPGRDPDVMDLDVLQASIFATAFGLGHLSGMNSERLNANGVPHE